MNKGEKEKKNKKQESIKNSEKSPLTSAWANASRGLYSGQASIRDFKLIMFFWEVWVKYTFTI